MLMSQCNSTLADSSSSWICFNVGNIYPSNTTGNTE